MIKLIKGIYNKTRFHTKLLITYSSIVILILLILSAFFYRYVYIMHVENVKKSFQQTATTIKKRIDYSFSEMEIVSDRVKESEDLKNQLYKYKEEESIIGNRFAYNLWMKKMLLDTLSMDSDIYRVSVFNGKGDFLSTNDYTYDQNLFSKNVIESQWIKEFDLPATREVIREPHYDEWQRNRHTLVYSVVKPLIVFNEIVGFVEVQRKANEYSEITSDLGNNAYTAIINSDKRVFYSSGDLDNKILIEHYLKVSLSEEGGMQIVSNPFSKVQEIITYIKTKNGWTAFIIVNYAKVLEPLNSVQMVIFLAVLIITFASVLFIYIFSKRLTVPLRRLKENIDTINVNSLNKNVLEKVHPEYNEIDAINESFEEMQNRLRDSIEREVKSRSLQANAHFDALQARINPHFIFNMLGVIVNMCEEEDKDNIAYVCKKLAKMLRYSTKSSDAITTLGEEIDHARDYLHLMKCRFEHRLIYDINVDENLLSVPIPKFIVQPLIENSIAHGFNNSNVLVMHIKIYCIGVGDGNWELTILDNGSGFKTEILSNVNERIFQYKDKVLKLEKPEELTIGGMGLINTFVRLSLYFGDSINFEICNQKPTGALIKIICPILAEERT